MNIESQSKHISTRKHNPDIPPVGKEVLVGNTAQKQRKGGTLNPAWLGPYKISKQLKRVFMKL